MPPELKQRLEKSAKKNNRSLNSEVVFWLQQAMDDAELMAEAENDHARHIEPRVVHEATMAVKVPSPKTVVVGEAYKKMVEELTSEVVKNLITSPRFKIIPLDPSTPNDDDYVEEDQPKP